MMLIGSRAIRMHIPEFRKPVDWDLIGTHAEAERLARLLPSNPRVRDSSSKVNFIYQGAPMEMMIAAEYPAWGELLEHLKNEATVEFPVLGEVIIPPASFLMLTKHTALGYPVVNWHKNMREVYLMRNYLPEMPEHIAQTVPMLQRQCGIMYAKARERASRYPSSCHPKAVQYQDTELHRKLHDYMKLGDIPMVDLPGAWQAFPDMPAEERKDAMRRVLAEEAMVGGGHYYVENYRGVAPRESRETKRYSLRTLLTGGLPQAWRYFGVNNYREIAKLIPEDFLDRMSVFESYRPHAPNSCSNEAAPFLNEDAVSSSVHAK